MSPRPVRSAPLAVALRLLLVAIAPAAGALVLWRLGAAPWTGPPAGVELVAWATARPVDALAAGVRAGGLLVCGWTAVATWLDLLARALTGGRGVRVLRGLAGRRWRRLVDSAVALSLTTGGVGLAQTTAPAAVLAAPAPPGVVAPAGSAPEGARADGAAPDSADAPRPSPPSPREPSVTGRTPPPAAGPARPAPAPPPAAPAAADDARGVRIVVARPGDHLWRLAAQELARVRGASPAELGAHDVAPYWRRVVAANRDRLRSGDPDLLFPGESVVLPASADG